jgi:hypothetical protein
MSDDPRQSTAEPEDEFAGIEPAPAQRSPLVAVSVLLLSLVVGYRLRADIAYFFGPREPIELGAAHKIDVGTLRNNTYVRLSGIPDRRNAIYIEPKGAQSRRTFFALHGTDNHLFVNAAPMLEPGDNWQGRLRRIDQVSYASSLQAHFAEAKVLRYLDLAELQKTQFRGVLMLKDRAGKSISFDSARELLELDVSFPEQYQIEMPREKFATEGDARHELERLKLEVMQSIETKDSYGYILHIAPNKRDATLKLLGDQRINVAPHDEHFKVVPGELELVDGKLMLPPRSWQPQLFWGRVEKPPKPDFFAAGVPWSWVRDAAVELASPIPQNAFVLDEGERPSDFWWPPVVLGLLLAFAGYNLWYLVRARRKTAHS